jgi:hypothetical protein
MDDRGALDLTKRIEDLEGQKKFLQETCRRAGREIKIKEDTINKLEDLLKVIQRGPDYENKHHDTTED